MDTKYISEWLRGYAVGLKAAGNQAAADMISEAAVQIEELEITLENTRRNLGDARADQQRTEEDRDHLLAIAKKMHLWIFRHTADEFAVYKECGLTGEDDARLGYGGQFVIASEEKT